MANGKAKQRPVVLAIWCDGKVEKRVVDHLVGKLLVFNKMRVEKYPSSRTVPGSVVTGSLAVGPLMRRTAP